jgi:hypothetical protein
MRSFALPDTSESDLVADSVNSYCDKEWPVGLERKLASRVAREVADQQLGSCFRLFRAGIIGLYSILDLTWFSTTSGVSHGYVIWSFSGLTQLASGWNRNSFK